tara:strand:- start:114 stop:533 length:420 start_codon:yes stop_codon:yes gene_type:complete
MGNTFSKVNRMNFEDIQEAIKNKNDYILINTLPASEQNILIMNTVKADDEIRVVETAIKAKKFIIIYGRNNSDQSIFDKYTQILRLGHTKLYLYMGGIFEWLLLQDIYGDDQFKTTSRELDILKYKPISTFKTLYLTDN